MTLDDSKGCPGYRRITGPLAGICIACERLGKSGQQITPAAKRVPSQWSMGEWVCDERRFHASTVGAPKESATPKG